MYIHRVILKDVPGIPDRDLTLFDDWTKKPLESVLLTGPNGSGKTTTLRIIAALWRKFANWLWIRDTTNPLEDPLEALADTPEVLQQVGLAAIEIHGLIEQPLWIYEIQRNRNREKMIGFINLVRLEAEQSKGLLIGGYARTLTSGEEHIEAEWFKNLAGQAEKLQLGISDMGQMLPNMVFLEAETRHIVVAQDKDKGAYPEPLHQWLATYSATDRWTDHIEAMLRNLKVRDPQWFYDTLKHINAFLEQNGKHLSDFDRNLRLMVKTDDKAEAHYVDKLSSGEQQCLILIFMISRWLMPGGIVLIDEPDLHMHISWQRAIIRELETLVHEKNGQIIVTSHSPTFWEEYNTRQRFNLNLEPVR